MKRWTGGMNKDLLLIVFNNVYGSRKRNTDKRKSGLEFKKMWAKKLPALRNSPE
jgi:hypothetical protein